ncbi:DNA oxidative demethylase ALKBH2 [Paramyrothecium foliicola]|nr:DNA oxidative demethylase ALKBH2 [Paramyrothecium foliicola]
MSKKRTLDAFFGAAPKRLRSAVEEPQEIDTAGASYHKQYPFPIKNLPSSLSRELQSLPARPGTVINDQPDLDLLYFEPYVPGYLAKDLFEFLRSELPFYRVEYKIRRGGIETQIRTPRSVDMIPPIRLLLKESKHRWTTVFGLDETSRFYVDGSVVDATTGVTASDKRYDRYPPRPLPKCLDDLRLSTEAATDCKFNFCLVNYYASGSDSISYHSDDEMFLGKNPAIASFSLGARRDFLMKHKPIVPGQGETATAVAKPLKLPLGSGDMVLMRGSTQSKWLHSIPKRTGKNGDDGGRINITFRKAMVKGGTENYYNYNVGSGPVYRWNKDRREMVVWHANET